MEISRIRALRGPNLWSRHTAIQALVLCDENERAISHLPGFEARVTAEASGSLEVTAHDPDAGS